jgi:propanediol utilization protein
MTGSKLCIENYKIKEAKSIEVRKPLEKGEGAVVALRHHHMWPTPASESAPT